MMNGSKMKRQVWSIAAVAIVAAASIGCSDQSPTGPAATDSSIQTIGPLIDNRAGQKGDTFAWKSPVERVDFKNGTIFFAKGFSVIVSADAVVRLSPSNRLIQFDEENVHAGATITVRGYFKENGTAIAESLEVHEELGDNTVRPTAN